MSARRTMRRTASLSARRGMTLIEVVMAMLILTGALPWRQHGGDWHA